MSIPRTSSNGSAESISKVQIARRSSVGSTISAHLAPVPLIVILVDMARSIVFGRCVRCKSEAQTPRNSEKEREYKNDVIATE